MQGQVVLFDPSTKTRFMKGTNLLGSKEVVGGYIIRISDFSLLRKLDHYRETLKGVKP